VYGGRLGSYSLLCAPDIDRWRMKNLLQLIFLSSEIKTRNFSFTIWPSVTMNHDGILLVERYCSMSRVQDRTCESELVGETHSCVFRKTPKRTPFMCLLLVTLVTTWRADIIDLCKCDLLLRTLGTNDRTKVMDWLDCFRVDVYLWMTLHFYHCNLLIFTAVFRMRNILSWLVDW